MITEKPSFYSVVWQTVCCKWGFQIISMELSWFFQLDLNDNTQSTQN